MKSQKPLLLVLAGALIVVILFSFKNEELTKESATLTYSTVAPYKPITFYYKNEVREFQRTKGMELETEMSNILNSLANEKWSLVTDEHATASSGGFYRIIRLERSR